MRLITRAGVAAAATLLTATTVSAMSVDAAPPTDTAAGRAAPALKVRELVKGLSQPWDVQRLPTGGLVIAERDSARLLLANRGKVSELADLSDQVWVSGETGLMSIAVDPNFRHNRQLFVCHGGFSPNGDPDVRVSRVTLNAKVTKVSKVDLFLPGIAATTGRHGGCRVKIDQRTGALVVGTGDAAVGTNPQDLTSLGGKVLRMDRERANPWPSNPFIDAEDPHERLIWTYGHRNVQGLAQRADGTWWSVEQGSDRDDEVNRLVNGANFGWNPVPGYNESVPMTDTNLPGKVREAAWNSGKPTLATSGGSWVHGSRWGTLDGTLAVATLKASRLVFLAADDGGEMFITATPPELRQYGRLRSVTSLPSGALLVTTANGSDDMVLKIKPRR